MRQRHSHGSSRVKVWPTKNHYRSHTPNKAGRVVFHGGSQGQTLHKVSSHASIKFWSKGVVNCDK